MMYPPKLEPFPCIVRWVNQSKSTPCKVTGESFEWYVATLLLNISGGLALGFVTTLHKTYSHNHLYPYQLHMGIPTQETSL